MIIMKKMPGETLAKLGHIYNLGIMGLSRATKKRANPRILKTIMAFLPVLLTSTHTKILTIGLQQQTIKIDRSLMKETLIKISSRRWSMCNMIPMVSSMILIKAKKRK